MLCSWLHIKRYSWQRKGLTYEKTKLALKDDSPLRRVFW